MYRGAIVLEYCERTNHWQALAWWVHDNIRAYSSMCFFPKLAAFNITWSKKPEKRIDSHITPRGCLTKPGSANSKDAELARHRVAMREANPPMSPKPATERARAAGRCLGQRQTAEPVLDRTLPRRESAEVDLVLGVAALRSSGRGQPWIVSSQPEKSTGVEQESPPGSLPPSNASRRSSGRGSKKLAGMTIPRSIPTGRACAGRLGTGRISTIGTLRRQRRTVSPLSTLSR